jgi:TIR domain
VNFVFLSHRSIDKPRIRPFVLELIDRQIPVWIDNFEEFNLGIDGTKRRIDEQDLAGGIEKLRDWPTQIDHALVRAFAVVVFWSKNWTTDRAILTREHGAAHIFGNVGYSTYIPVLLDDTDQLDPGVIAYREAVHDTVQAFNVARYGQSHWTALLEAVQKLWQQRMSAPPNPVVSSVALTNVDWLAELATTPLCQCG